jgi:hypothetical protein
MGQNIRYDKEVRQIGGLMLILSLAVMVFPMYDTTSRISLDITENPLYNGDNEALNWALLAGDLCVILLGMLGMTIGFMAITDGGIVFVTLIGLIWEQTAFIDWIGKMYHLSEYSKYRCLCFCYLVLNLSDYKTYEEYKLTPLATLNSISPSEYKEIGDNPSSDVQFYFAMGILKMLFICFLLYGSLGLALFTLYAFQTHKGHTKNARYYSTRLVFFSFMYCGHGLFPFLVQGTKVYIDNKDDLPAKSPIIAVVGQPITHPEITIAMGVIFTLIGIWGMARGLGIAPKGDRFFQLAVGFAYMSYVATVILTEFSIAGASGMASMAAVVAINAHVILAYLDQKAGTVPEEMDEDYYHDDAIVTKNFGQEQAPLNESENEEIEEEVIEAEGMA